ncbi:MAG: hypothetical protein IPM16_04755 [Chloroflexi bacterium]|nr:hypothetical protein [Chloroflexota bacterium]
MQKFVIFVLLVATACSGGNEGRLVGEWIIFVCDLPLWSLNIYKVRPDGSELTQVHTSDDYRMHYSGFSVSADGTELLYIENYQLIAMSLSTGHKRRLLQGSTQTGFDSDFVYDQETDQFVVDTSMNLTGDVSGRLYLFNNASEPKLNKAIPGIELGLGSLVSTSLTGAISNAISIVNLETDEVDQYLINPRDYDGLRLGRTQTSPNGEFTLFEIEQRRQSPDFDAASEFIPALSFSPTFRYDLYRMDSRTGEINRIAQGIQSRALISPDGEQIAYSQYNDEVNEYRLIISRLDGSDPTVVLRHPCMRALGSWSHTPRPQRAGQQFTQPAIPLIQPPAPPPPAS